MKDQFMRAIIAAAFFLLAGGGCAFHGGAAIPVDTASSAPGTMVSVKGESWHQLVGSPLQVGGPLPATALIDAFTMKKVDISQMKGKVLLLSVVPSIDTKVCEAQTHLLAEKGARLPQDVVLIARAGDTPFAQKRFAEEAKLTGLNFLSDYKEGAFGRATGLLIDDSMLLARSVLVVDKDGIVRYIQVVPELSHLPDMETAVGKAMALSGK